jgi:hypothetical protein
MPARLLPAGAIEALRRRLSTLPSRRAERRQMIRETATTYRVSETTVYRALQRRTAMQAVHRGDRGTPRVLPQDQLERYCELIAAMSCGPRTSRGGTCRRRRRFDSWKTTASRPQTGSSARPRAS